MDNRFKYIDDGYYLTITSEMRQVDTIREES